MVEITSFIISDSAENQNSKGIGINRLLLINPRNNLVLPFIPSAFTFAVTFGLLGLPVHSRIKLNCSLINPFGKLIATTGDMTLKTSNLTDVDNPEVGGGMMMNFTMNNVVFEKPGIHKFVITIDNQKKGIYSVYVAKLKKRTGGVNNGINQPDNHTK